MPSDAQQGFDIVFVSVLLIQRTIEKLFMLDAGYSRMTRKEETYEVVSIQALEGKA